MKKTFVLMVFAVFGLLQITMPHLLTANPGGQPVAVTADTIRYDSANGQVDARGSVIMEQSGSTITGSEAHYNMKSLEGIVTGGVKAIKQDATLTAAEVKTYNNTRLVATGSPVLTKGQATVTGSLIDYDSVTQYALIPSDPVLTDPDGTLTANKVEVFFADDKAVGDGSVHLVSPTRQVDATGDHIVYYGLQTSGQGHAVLSGNARAVQEGNLLVGDTLTISMADQSADAQGRTKLVITPKE